jgi:hypothetical protein
MSSPWTIGVGSSGITSTPPSGSSGRVQSWASQATSRFVPLLTPSFIFFPQFKIIQIFPDNEIRKGEFEMQLKKLHGIQGQLKWPADSKDLPIISWQSCKPSF